MKKYILLILALLLPSIASANVDTTNVFNFTYDKNTCILHTNFNLGGHHNYLREYKIIIPGVISIGDEKHTTLSESIGLSIGGCDEYKPVCDFTEYSDWEYDERVIDVLSISYTSSGEVILSESGDNSFSLKNESGKEVNFTTEEKEFDTEEKDLNIKLSSGALTVSAGTGVLYKYDLDITEGVENEYSIVQEEGKITLKKDVYKRTGTGIANSEGGVFEAYTGLNTESGNYGGLCPNPTKDTPNNGYCAGLNYWDYQQHNYTTTKVKVANTSFPCSGTEYNDETLGTETTYDYEGTLGGANFQEPEFTGVTINDKSPENGYFIIEASSSLKISDLEQLKVFKNGPSNIIGVKSVKVTIKENDITLGEYTQIYPEVYKEDGVVLPAFEVSLKSLTSDEIITEKKGNYHIVFTFFEETGVQQLGTYEAGLLIIPNNNFVLSEAPEVSVQNNIFANSEDYLRICQSFTDNFLNKINRTEDISLDYIQAKDPLTLVSNAVITKDSKVCFDVARLAPGLIGEIEFYIPKHKIEKNLSFDGVNKVGPFVLDFGNNDLGNGEGDLSCLDKTSDVICKIPENLSPEFKSPFSVSLKVIDNITGDLNGQPIMGQKQEYVLTLINNGLKLDITNGNLDINRNSVKPISNGHIWLTQAEGFKIVSNESFISTNGYLNPQEFKFQAQVDVGTPDLEEILKGIEVSTKDLLISYTINGQFVSYPLDDVSIKGCEDISTLGVKVVGTVQGSGINQSAGLESNFSDLSKSEARAKIRQNAYTLVKNMKSGDVLNGVKYVEGNIRISGDLDYETLIIKDGNVIIDGDLNTSNNKLGIIVLRDGYNVLTDWNKFGNVYVSNTVEEINAIIYADGALRSADKNGNSYGDNQLGDRLTIFGSLFTRNTIGGVIGGGASMTLPGGQKTNNYELASVYDLNYIRKTPICSADDYSLLIKYNPSITTNPPKGFTN